MKCLLQDMDVLNNMVIVRCDFNVPLKDGHILDDIKIKASLETINYLIEKNCKIILLSHMGKVKTLEDKKKEYDDYKDLIVKSYKGNQSQYTYLNPVFTDSGNNIVQTYEEVLSRQLLREAISELKSNLSSTDYMIIKTYEAKINNEDAPYSSDRMDEVMEERKNYRKKINELELLLDKAK